MNVHFEGFTCDACDSEYDAFAIQEYGVQYNHVGDLVLCECCVTDFNHGLDHLETNARNLRGMNAKSRKTGKTG